MSEPRTFDYSKEQGLLALRGGLLVPVGLILPEDRMGFGFRLATRMESLPGSLSDLVIEHYKGLEGPLARVHFVTRLVNYCGSDDDVAGLVGDEYDPFENEMNAYRKVADRQEPPKPSEKVAELARKVVDADLVEESLAIVEALDAVESSLVSGNIDGVDQATGEVISGASPESKDPEDFHSPDYDGITSVTISGAGKTVVLTPEAMDRLSRSFNKEDEEKEEEHPIQLSGKGLNALLKEFANKKDGRIAVRSIGVSRTAIAATDMASVILLGKSDGSPFRTTDDRRAGVEVAWSNEFQKWARLASLPPAGHDADIESPILEGMEDFGIQYPDVTSVLAKMPLDSMQEVAQLDPAMVLRAAKTLVALGAPKMTLYHDGKGVVLGFKALACPSMGNGEDKEFANPFPVEGRLFTGRRDKQEEDS